MKFGEKIKLLRMQRGWEIDGLAMKAGISRATVYAVEASKWHTEFNMRTVDRLATAFRLTRDELLAYAGGMNANYWATHDLSTHEQEAKYAAPPTYIPNDIDKIDVQKGGAPRAGFEGLSAVMAWFKELSRPDQQAFFAMIREYVATPPAAVAAEKPPELRAAAAERLRPRQSSRRAAS